MDAKEAGASHALVLTPGVWPNQMTKKNILQFHRDVRLCNYISLCTRLKPRIEPVKVADASPIPTMIYNFPVVTAGINLDSDTIAALGEHPNIVGTKLSCADVGKLNRLTSKLSPSKFAAFPGSSSVFLQGLVVGSAGIIGALPNVVPRAHVKLYKLWKAGNLAEAQKLQAQLANADWELQKLGSIAGIKRGGRRYGLDKDCEA